MSRGRSDVAGDKWIRAGEGVRSSSPRRGASIFGWCRRIARRREGALSLGASPSVEHAGHGSLPADAAARPFVPMEQGSASGSEGNRTTVRSFGRENRPISPSEPSGKAVSQERRPACIAAFRSVIWTKSTRFSRRSSSSTDREASVYCRGFGSPRSRSAKLACLELSDVASDEEDIRAVAPATGHSRLRPDRWGVDS